MYEIYHLLFNSSQNGKNLSSSSLLFVRDEIFHLPSNPLIFFQSSSSPYSISNYSFHSLKFSLIYYFKNHNHTSSHNLSLSQILDEYIKEISSLFYSICHLNQQQHEENETNYMNERNEIRSSSFYIFDDEIQEPILQLSSKI